MLSDAAVSALWQYGTVFALLVGAGFGLPMPEELPIAMGGGMAGHASDNPDSLVVWWVMLPLCMLGVVLADGALYAAGRVWGTRLLERQWVRKILPVEKQERLRANFERYGVTILLAARLTPGVRTPVFLMAGVTRMPLSRFLFADGLYAIPGVSLIFALGYFLGDSFVASVKQVGEYKPLIIAVLTGVAIGFLLNHLMRRKVATGHPEEIPLVGRRVDEYLAGRSGRHPLEERYRPLSGAPEAQEIPAGEAPQAADADGGLVRPPGAA